ncbi:MAG: MBL fold metallo-hydrolase, partial [Candidatus Aenigmarchaeota archaeon]|nr:MBL fold metallo-hydrolase [Candidatus Aenigmarchaeota archaeon]
MQIKLWGVRGSLPSPTTNKEYQDKIRSILQKAAETGFNRETHVDEFIDSLPDSIKYVYGGDTTCATVTSRSGKSYIIDCGSGIRPYGYDLM